MPYHAIPSHTNCSPSIQSNVRPAEHHRTGSLTGYWIETRGYVYVHLGRTWKNPARKKKQLSFRPLPFRCSPVAWTCPDEFPIEPLSCLPFSMIHRACCSVCSEPKQGESGQSQPRIGNSVTGSQRRRLGFLHYLSLTINLLYDNQTSLYRRIHTACWPSGSPFAVNYHSCASHRSASHRIASHRNRTTTPGNGNPGCLA